jgi:predicted unusual protein kinase regulating ubiquinone biosynthesis (AarF/ABC1/UbiB family)
MRRPSSLAARRAIELFDSAPRGDRFHVRVRWWTAPFVAIDAAVPQKGRILEVGCGHGLLSAFLALSSAGREVCGIDIDEHKVLLARGAASNLAEGEARLRFDHASPGELPSGQWDAIVVADVLYLLDSRAKRSLLAELVERLAPDGQLIVKETDTAPAWKDKLTRFQERLSTGVLGITEGATLDFEPAAALLHELRLLGLDADLRRIDRGYPHPHVLIVGRRTEAASSAEPDRSSSPRPRWARSNPPISISAKVRRWRRQGRVWRLTARRGAHWLVTKARGVGRDEARRAELEERFAVRSAEDVASELGNMKGAIMKLGQMISFIAEGLPPEAQQALASLQQDVPPMAPSLAERVIVEDLGAPPTQLFLDWQPVPVAAASIGQVHKAVLRDGRQVAVKVQYPGVDEAIRHDLDNAEFFYGLFASMALRNLDVASLVDELRERMADELDYRIEARHQQEFVDRYRGHPFIRIPEVFAEHSSRRVLVTEWVDGMNWSEFEHRASEPLRQRAAEVVFRFAQGSVHQHRIFNGDPHPGNYRFHHDGTVTFLDFGLVKRWERDEFDSLMPVLDTVLARDAFGTVDRMVEAGFLAVDHGLDPPHIFGCVSLPYRAFLDEEFTYTRDYTTEALQALTDFSGPYADVIKVLNMPSGFVVLDRVVWGVSALLGRLGAHNRWRAILAEYRELGPPATELGVLEAAWAEGG